MSFYCRYFFCENTSIGLEKGFVGLAVMLENCINTVRGTPPTVPRRMRKKEAWGHVQTNLCNSSFAIAEKLNEHDTPSPRTPHDKIMMPLINGSNVTMASPDPMSKYFEGMQQNGSFKSPQHFNKHIGIDTVNHSTTPVPMISGSNVTLDSPDPLSRFNETKNAQVSFASYF